MRLVRSQHAIMHFLWQWKSFFVQQGIRSAGKEIQIFNGRMSYIILIGCSCDIAVSNVHAPTEDKSDDTTNSFYEELDHIFDQFPKVPHKNVNAKVDIFKPTIGNESVHEIGNNNGVRIINFAISKL